MSNVKLAVRVRPFTEKELRSEKDRVSVVGVVDENTVIITNVKVSLSGAGDSRERIRQYYADFTFDSSCPVTHSTYASQEKIFYSIGRSVISSVSQGCSACVLAYGQSATGKTHTMMGSETQPGLIPRLCKALYEQQCQTTEFTISFLEIYNERVHDLLCGEAPLSTCHSLPRRKGNARKDLRVREHPQRGTYVQNLRRVAVHNEEALLALVAEGVKRRRTAATKRNSSSSRSHALLEIATPHATLHLADLAGSEKASWEGCGGGRQKEGANINKSLVALSNVISALVNGGAVRGKFVPYRDSALTWLLKDCFTGGANTFIIATISPSAACYGETASTLRWAARARQLPTPRPTNTNSNIATRAALQAQFNQLIAELTKYHIRYIPETGSIKFEEQHWEHLKNDFKENGINKTAKIGNILSMTRLKSDANSESTASSIASGSSDVINAMDKNINITNEINKEMDKLFGPALERTSSGDDLKVVAPLRHKKRQCRSHEVLSVDETIDTKPVDNLSKYLPCQSDIEINKLPDAIKQKVSNTTILHDNQRAEIVASVTERLYSKLKKKEENVVSKAESIVEKKIVEPLSELKICTNARQRLMDLSQKAAKNRRKIGIPAHTQTKRFVTRVKDQAIDVQTDLYSYTLGPRRPYIFYRDVATETVPMTPRCKEIAVGPTGSLSLCDRSTGTKPVICKNSVMMTERVAKSEIQTQTRVLPPPRRKKRTVSKKCSCEAQNRSRECSTPPVISINISQTFPVDSEFQSSDDYSDSLGKSRKNTTNTSTPDLLSNHNITDAANIDEIKKQNMCVDVNVTDQTCNSNKQEIVKSLDSNEEFPDTDELLLPKVNPNIMKNSNQIDIKNMILGRNNQMYPYNIVLSPQKERDSKKLVTFKDIDDNPTIAIATASKIESQNGKNVQNEHKNFDEDCFVLNDYESTYSDATESSKTDTDSFIWKNGVQSKTLDPVRSNRIPVSKRTKCKTSQAKILKDFLGFEKPKDVKERPLQSYMSTANVNDNISSSDSLETLNIPDYNYHVRKTHVNNTFSYNNRKDQYQYMEKKLLDSCIDAEESVKKYEIYVENARQSMKIEGAYAKARSPKELLQHLVQMRRDVVKAESDYTDSSIDMLNK